MREEFVRVARFGSSPVVEPSVTSLQVSQTLSSWMVRSLPSRNKASSLAVNPGTGPPAPGGPPRTPGSFCAKQRQTKERAKIAARRVSRESNTMRYLQLEMLVYVSHG